MTSQTTPQTIVPESEIASAIDRDALKAENAELRDRITRLREMWLDKARFSPLWHAEFKRVLGIN